MVKICEGDKLIDGDGKIWNVVSFSFTWDLLSLPIRSFFIDNGTHIIKLTEDFLLNKIRSGFYVHILTRGTGL